MVAFRYHREDNMSDLKRLAVRVMELKAQHEAKKMKERIDYLRYCSGFEQYEAPRPDFSRLGF